MSQSRRAPDRLAGDEVRVDVVVVGSGAAGLTAALAARDAGLEVLVLESTGLVGGSSAMSGGGIWAPANPLMVEAGVPDSSEAARAYLDAVVGDVGPASSPGRRQAFLTEVPAMVAWLRVLGFRFERSDALPDYYLDRPGASSRGREVVGARWDSRCLGAWARRVRGVLPLPVHAAEVSELVVAGRTTRGLLTAGRVVAADAAARLTGRRLFSAGNSLIGQLLHLLLDRGVPVWLDSPLVELVADGPDAVGGVLVRTHGRTVRVLARRAVVLAAGGFAHDEPMRRQHLSGPSSDRFSLAAPGDRGDAIRAGLAVGAATALMDEAWWGPTMIDPRGRAAFVLWERCLPFGFMVDSAGRRFCDESTVHEDVGRALLGLPGGGSAAPAHLVVDSRHRAYYPFGRCLPRVTPPGWIRSGFMTRSDSLTALASRIGVDPAGLVATAGRFAEFARTGRDEDFGRGSSGVDRPVYLDPRVTPDPNLGAVARPPFYAVQVWPGDVGTKGGLLTDELARVLRDDGSMIDGLYAAGNCAATVMGRAFPAPGATLGPAMTFGYVAGRHAARRPVGR